MSSVRTRNTIIPSKISSKSKRFMRELMSVLDEKAVHTTLDKSAIQLIAHTYDNWLQATEMLEKDGLTIYNYTSAGRNLKAHPAVKIQLDAQIQLTKLLIEFGLTPKSRKDVNSARQTPDASPLELFLTNASQPSS